MSGTVRITSVVWFGTGVVAAAIVMILGIRAWSVDAAPGDTDSTFVPTTPCRLIDTRTPGAETFEPGETRTLVAHGSNGDCAIPSTAVALSTNVTSVAATERTFLTFWPGGPQPETSSMNPFPGEPPTPNGVTVQLSNTGTFEVFNLAGNVDVIVDIDGYYVSSSLTELAERVAALELAEPFTVRTLSGGGGPVGSAVTSVKDLTVTAPVDGTVSVISTGYVYGQGNGEITSCGIMDKVEVPFAGVAALWQSPTGSDYDHFSVTRTFDFDAGETQTLRLVCRNPNGTTNINSPQLTALFTPDPQS